MKIVFFRFYSSNLIELILITSYKLQMTIRKTTLLLISVISVAFAFAQNTEDKSKLQLVKVASLNTIEANKEFQRNVQLVQQQRALAAQLLSKMENVQDLDEREKLEKEFNALEQKLNENNELMFKTYGFSLNRNYVLTVEKSHIHMWVTPEEAKKIDQAADSREKAKKSK